MRAEYAVQVLLLGTVVVARASDAHSQQPAVETQARIRVADDDRRVVDTEKERVLALPAGIALTSGKLQDFEDVSIGILEVEGSDPSGIRVPVRQPLRRGRGVLHLGGAQAGIGRVHVAHDDGGVLEGVVVAARVLGNATAARSKVLGEFQALGAELQARRPRVRREDARERL